MIDKLTNFPWCRDCPSAGEGIFCNLCRKHELGEEPLSETEQSLFITFRRLCNILLSSNNIEDNIKQQIKDLLNGD